MLGQHRDPAWWDAGKEEPSASGRSAMSGRQVRSARDPKQMLTDSQDTFAARRAAAAGRGPKPEARATGSSPVITRLQGA